MSEPINLEGATVPFEKSIVDNQVIYQFDTSHCGHPEPMVNALVGLEHLKIDEKLVMINMRSPLGLFPKIENDFSYEVKEREDGKFQITFQRKGAEVSTDFKDNSCNGLD